MCVTTATAIALYMIYSIFHSRSHYWLTVWQAKCTISLQTYVSELQTCVLTSNLCLKTTITGLWCSNMGFKRSIIGFKIWHFKTHDLILKPMFVQKYVCHVHNKSTNIGL